MCFARPSAPNLVTQGTDNPESTYITSPVRVPSGNSPQDPSVSSAKRIPMSNLLITDSVSSSAKGGS